MNEQQAHRAAKSRAGQCFVVYVPDQGYDIYTADQCRRYASLIFVEAAYIDGVRVSDKKAIGESVIRSALY